MRKIKKFLELNKKKLPFVINNTINLKETQIRTKRYLEILTLKMSV